MARAGGFCCRPCTTPGVRLRHSFANGTTRNGYARIITKVDLRTNATICALSDRNQLLGRASVYLSNDAFNHT